MARAGGDVAFEQPVRLTMLAVPGRPAARVLAVTAGWSRYELLLADLDRARLVARWLPPGEGVFANSSFLRGDPIMLAESGGAYLLGDGLTALDLYWATFCNLIAPLPPDQLPMAERMRPMFTATEPDVHELLAKTGLLAHRDRIYRDHLELPVVL